MKQVFIALGTNIEPRSTHLLQAIELLQTHENIKLEEKSSIYETVPVGYIEQADFLNMVVCIYTTLKSEQLLNYCQSIEQELGRKREFRFGPRTIDLDILLYNQENSKTERLTIPHPRMHERAFVLIPLKELAPDLVLPTQSGKRVRDMINELPESDIKDVTIWTQNESAEE